MILDPDTCMYDAYIYPDTLDYDAHMYDAFIHDSCIHDACIRDACIRATCINDATCINADPDTCMYGAYIYVPRSLTLKHACVYDAIVYDP